MCAMRHPVRERLDAHENNLTTLSRIGAGILQVLALIAGLLLIGLMR